MIVIVIMIVIAVMVAIVLMVFMVSTVLTIPAMLVLVVVPMFVVMLTVAWGVDLVIPAVRYEIDRSSACVVFAAVPCPMSFMTWWHMQIQRLWRGRTLRYDHGYSHNRPGEDQLGRRNVCTDRNLSIQTGYIDVH